MPKLYIIAGCNGAGKTTASYTVLVAKSSSMPMKLQKGLSPFNPESVAIEAGRLMLQRMDDLLAEGADFAFETTLATPFLCEIYRTGTRERLLCNPTLFLAADS